MLSFGFFRNYSNGRWCVEFWILLDFLELACLVLEELCSGVFEIGGFGPGPLQNVLKTTFKGRSLGRGTIYIYIHAHACMYACVHACMYVWMHACMHTCICVCMYLCLYVYI